MYTFINWVFTPSNTTNENAFEFGTTKVYENLTLNAKWEQTHVYINLDIQDGDFFVKKD